MKFSAKICVIHTGTTWIDLYDVNTEDPSAYVKHVVHQYNIFLKNNEGNTSSRRKDVEVRTGIPQ